jgi:twinkle protein
VRILVEIQQIKDKFGQAAEEIIATGLNMENKGKKYRCPNSYAHRHGDRNPSMSWDNKALQFHCFGCGMNIDIYGYFREHLNYTHAEVAKELQDKIDYKQTSMQKNRDIFQSELKHITPITEECIEYIKLRGITEETINKFNLKSYNGLIAFPYYRYETLVGYKTRKPVKNPGTPKMLSVAGSKPYLFNAQNIEFTDELIICEGEFDCMVISQCGYDNVVSVGAGANSMTALLEQAVEVFEKFQSLIIVSDNDEAGQNMDRIFLERYKDKVKLIDKNLYANKDINEEYVLSGKDKVIELIESARFKIEGRRDLDKKPYKGLKVRTGNYIPTGINTIDSAINDLAPGAVTLLTGRSNGGKTSFTRQIIANAIEKGNRVFVVSGEGDQELFINELYQCVIGRNKDYYNLVKINKRYHKEPKPEVMQAIQQWHKDKLVIFSKGESKLKTMDELFNVIDYEIKINRHNLIVIDNLMSVLSVQASEKYEAQADFMQRCVNLAQAYRCHIILVLHPNKTYQKGKDMDLEQISGTMDLGNKSDNVIAVIREYDESKIAEGINGRISVIKNRYYPDLPTVEVHFEKETGLLLEIDEETRDLIAYNFTWDKPIKKDWHEVDELPPDCPF